MSSDEKHLKKIGRTWYVRRKIPADVRHHYRKTHWLRSLHTDSLEVAQRKRHAVLALAEEEFRAKRNAGSEDQVARELRVAIRGAETNPGAPGEPSERDLLDIVASDHADELVRRGMSERAANRWFALATSVRPTLDEAASDWLATVEKNETRLSYRKAVADLREFLGGNRPLHEIDRDAARRFVHEHLPGSGNAYATRRRKVNSLAALWNWLGERGTVRAEDPNPWHGWKLKKQQIDQGRPRRRAYSESELLRLLTSIDANYPGIAHLLLLALLTGARMEELAARRAGDVEPRGRIYFFSISTAKTEAGIRRIAIAHPVAAGILRARLKATETADDVLFPEFVPGGAGSRKGWRVSKKFGRLRDAAGLPRGTTFHSTRNNFMTTLENAGVDQVRIARYVGHKVGTMAADRYSAGSSEATSIEVAKKVRYSPTVEAAMRSLAARAPKVGEGTKGRWAAKAVPQAEEPTKKPMRTRRAAAA